MARPHIKQQPRPRDVRTGFCVETRVGRSYRASGGRRGGGSGGRGGGGGSEGSVARSCTTPYCSGETRAVAFSILRSMRRKAMNTAGYRNGMCLVRSADPLTTSYASMRRKAQHMPVTSDFATSKLFCFTIIEQLLLVGRSDNNSRDVDTIPFFVFCQASLSISRVSVFP